MKHPLYLTVFAAAIALAAVSHALAADLARTDRPPTAKERARIESVLRAAGYKRWGKIEFDDDGVWEVDDAVAADGRKYEVELNKAFRIISRELE